MFETVNAVLASAHELGLGSDAFRQVAPGRWESVLASVLERFTKSRNPDLTWLWEDLKIPGQSIQLSQALDRLGSMVDGQTPVWLLLEDWDRTKKHGAYWVFEGMYSAVIDVLRNTHGIEYYIVERGQSWMVLENHHDVLIGIGEPAESFVANLRST